MGTSAGRWVASPWMLFIRRSWEDNPRLVRGFAVVGVDVFIVFGS